MATLLLRARDSLFDACTRILPQKWADFLKVCRMQLLHPFQIFIVTPGVFFPFLSATDKDVLLNALRTGMDATSLRTLDLFLRRLDWLAQEEDVYAFMTVSMSFFPPHQREAIKQWKTALPALISQYRYPVNLMSPETFLAHHGLPMLPPRCLPYIARRDFIDLGAFIGDSVLIMMRYEPARIYAFEASHKNGRRFQRIMRQNHIPAEKVEFVPMGVSDTVGAASFNDQGTATSSFVSEGAPRVEVTTVDAFVENRNLQVGLIKMDIEGMGLQAVRGMVATLKRDRPVLSLAVYHCPDELLRIKPFIESLDLGYRFMLRELNPQAWFMETRLLAYPRELADATP